MKTTIKALFSLIIFSMIIFSNVHANDFIIETPIHDTLNDNKSIINTFAENVTASPGENVEVTFSVTDFYDVASISLTLKYDNSILNYLSTEYIHPDINTGTFNINQNPGGDLKVAWYSIYPVNIGNDDLFRVLFSYNGGYTEIKWDTLSTGACVYTGLDFIELPAIFHNGSVSIYNGLEISGSIIDDITLEGVEDVEVSFTGLGSVHTNQDGDYLQSVPMDWSGTSEPQKLYYSFEPEIRTYSNVNTNHEDQDFTGTYTPQHFNISGKITDSETSIGIEGIKVTFTGLPDVFTDQNGDYMQQVPFGWSGFSEPQSDSYKFQPEQIEYANVTVDITDQDFIGQKVFSISGLITDNSSGFGIENVEIDFDELGIVLTNSDGYYIIYVPDSWSGLAIPVKEGYSFDPLKREYFNVSSNLENEDYIGTLTAQFYFISGTILDNQSIGIENVIINFSNIGNVFTDSNGNYSQNVPSGWSGGATPELTGYIFEPESMYYENVNEDLSGQNYTGINTIIISGFILDNLSGDGIDGVNVNFTGIGAAQTNDQGFYSKEIGAGWSGNATPSKIGYLFQPEHRTYINVTVNTINQDYSGTLTDLTLNISADPQEICLGYPTQLNAIASGGSGNYTYSWLSNPVGFYSNEASPIVYPDTTTVYFAFVNDGETTVNDAINVIVNYLPATADQILGVDTVCIKEDQVIFYVDPIQNATEYLWIVPPGVSINSGSGTNSISVYFTEKSATGLISVRGINQCGIGSETFKEVIVNPLPEVSLDTFENVYVQLASYLLSGGHPDGGIFSGDFIIGNYFYPPSAGVGPHIITYYYTDPDNGCVNSASQILIVTNSPGVDENLDNLQTIRIFPNPSQGILCFELPIDIKFIDVSIFSMHGQMVFNSAINKTDIENLIHQIDISFLQRGIYLVKISNNHIIRTDKILLK
ncbi:MAG: T9SS type A sorting domain-containing protein [Bacteroidales bacterium]|nr:T9SS type A sorting domain-containing protein [Bacteroidales bacterium]